MSPRSSKLFEVHTLEAAHVHMTAIERGTGAGGEAHTVAPAVMMFSAIE
jgi:hypothetical protein